MLQRTPVCPALAERVVTVRVDEDRDVERSVYSELGLEYDIAQSS